MVSLCVSIGMRIHVTVLYLVYRTFHPLLLHSLEFQPTPKYHNEFFKADISAITVTT